MVTPSMVPQGWLQPAACKQRDIQFPLIFGILLDRIAARNCFWLRFKHKLYLLCGVKTLAKARAESFNHSSMWFAFALANKCQRGITKTKAQCCWDHVMLFSQQCAAPGYQFLNANRYVLSICSRKTYGFTRLEKLGLVWIKTPGRTHCSPRWESCSLLLHQYFSFPSTFNVKELMNSITNPCTPQTSGSTWTKPSQGKPAGEGWNLSKHDKINYLIMLGWLPASNNPQSKELLKPASGQG